MDAATDLLQLDQRRCALQLSFDIQRHALCRPSHLSRRDRLRVLAGREFLSRAFSTLECYGAHLHGAESGHPVAMQALDEVVCCKSVWSFPTAEDLERICAWTEGTNPEAARGDAMILCDGCGQLKNFPTRAVSAAA